MEQTYWNLSSTVNTYRKDPNKLRSVWEVKVEKATVKSEWSPSIKDQESLITEAKIIL